MGRSDRGNYRSRYENEKTKLADLERDEDAAAIRRWGNSLTTEYGTRSTQIKDIRMLSKRAAKIDLPPLIEWEDDAPFYRLHDRLESGDHPDQYVPDDGLAPGTLRNIRQAARNFFIDGLDREWAEDVTVGAPEQSNIDEDDIYSVDETEAIISACHHPMDLAYVTTILATGLRRSAVLSLDVGDLDFESEANGFVHLSNEDIGLKGMAGKRPLIWASPLVQNWLASHPRRNESDAPLICCLEDGSTWDDVAYARGEPLSPKGVDNRLDRIADRAGLDKSLRSHRLRHTAITRMYYDDLSEKRIKWLVGWGKDSTQFDRYVHLTDEKMMEGVLDHYGLGDSEESTGQPSFTKCPNESCRAPLHELANPKACPGCGLSLTHDAAQLNDSAEEAKADATDRAIDETDPEKIQAYKAIIDAVDDPFALAEQLPTSDE